MRNSKTLAAFFLATLLSCMTSWSQDPTFSFVGDAGADLLGWDVAGIGDVDADGIPDYIISALGSDTNGMNTGNVRVYSGQDGTVLYTLNGLNIEDLFGFSVAALGDVNADLIPDFIVGSIGVDTNGNDAGNIKVFSGSNGALIHSIDGDSADDHFGAAVGGGGDVDGDGLGDFIVGAPGDDNTGLDSGSTRVYSGLTGAVIYMINGTAATDEFGSSVAIIGDTNGDNFAEFIIGNPKEKYNGLPISYGEAHVYSGATGNVLYDYIGPHVAAELGNAVSGVGDVDADGAADFAIGSHFENPVGLGSGAVRVYSGASGSLIYTFHGFSPQSNLGSDVAAAGDVNGDGFDDILAGAPGAPANGLYGAGALNIYSGRDGAIIERFSGNFANGNLGTSVSGIGDINGDGVPDVIGGGWNDDSFAFQAGKALVFATRELGPIHGNVVGQNLGTSISSAGDVNNDGFLDLIVGVPNDHTIQNFTGSTRVVSGKNGKVLYTLNGDNHGDQFGTSVSGLGDIDLDGHDDFIVGAPNIFSNPNRPGFARVFSGLDGNIIFNIIGLSLSDSFGHAVSSAGDVNFDSIPDFIVGAPKANTANGVNSGSATVYSGANGSILYVFNGAAAGDELGTFVSGAGDVNGDGFADVIVGAPGDSTTANQAGGARVYSGLDGSILHDVKGSEAFNFFGAAVSGAGDLNADGFDDFVVGAPAADPNGAESGRARAFSGFDGSILYTFSGIDGGDLFGIAVCGVGDINNDGFDDLAIGAPRSDQPDLFAGSVTIYSGANGSIIKTLLGKTTGHGLGSAIAPAGDMNFDGFPDVFIGAKTAGFHGESSGTAEVFFSDTLPALNYSSNLGTHALSLTWLPTGGDIQALTGTINCSGATPGALGAAAVSLAPANILIFGIPLLVAPDATNLLINAGFGYSIFGDITFPGVTRQLPSIAGSLLHYQFFETSPIIRSSNGLRLTAVP